MIKARYYYYRVSSFTSNSLANLICIEKVKTSIKLKESKCLSYPVFSEHASYTHTLMGELETDYTLF